MDPNTALQQCRDAVGVLRILQHATDHGEQINPAVLAETAARLAEHFEALDDWLRGGGFLPAAWGRRERLSDEPMGHFTDD